MLAILAFVSMALLVSGCGYLTSFLIPPPFPNESFDPGLLSFSPDESFPTDFDPQPSPVAVWTHGTATVTIDGKTTTLASLVGDGKLTVDGGQVTWTDGAGWYVQIFGAAKDPVYAGAGPGYLGIDKIADGQHWMTADPSSCDIAVTKSDASGLKGTASCKDMRWGDYMAPFDDLTGPTLVKGEPAFDAMVTFEATP